MPTRTPPPLSTVLTFLYNKVFPPQPCNQPFLQGTVVSSGGYLLTDWARSCIYMYAHAQMYVYTIFFFYFNPSAYLRNQEFILMSQWQSNTAGFIFAIPLSKSAVPFSDSEKTRSCCPVYFLMFLSNPAIHRK